MSSGGIENWMPAPRAAGAAFAGSRIALHHDGAQVRGQEEAEDGAVASFCDRRAELDFAAVALDDGARDPQAKPGAALPFGGKEGLAEPALDGRVDAAAVVADGDADSSDSVIRPAARAADTDAQAAAERRRFNRVGNEVGEHLAHFAGIDDGLVMAIVLALDTDVLFRDAASVQGEHFLHQFVEVCAQRAGGFAGEIQGLAADLANALQLALGQGDVASGGCGQILFLTEEVEQVGNSLERVVDLVRDGGGEAANGDEL